MLLRRITEHVRAQNWFAVLLDFVIVVVGVFIGIQVANWNAVTQDKARTAAMLSRLEVDLRDMQVITEDQRDWYYQRTVELDGLLKQFEAGGTPSPEEANLVFDTALAARLPVNAPPSFEEMLAAGRLELIESEPLQDALREFATTVSYTNEGAKFLSENLSVSTMRLNRYVTYSRSPATELDRYYTVVDAVDLEAMWADSQARTDLAHVYDVHTNMQLLAQLRSREIEAVLTAIDAEND